MRFQITKMTVLSVPIVCENHTILAHMVAEYGSLRLTALNLVQLLDGRLRVWIPSQGRNRVVIKDPIERDQLIASAVTSFRALSGRDPAEPPLATASDHQDTRDEHA